MKIVDQRESPGLATLYLARLGGPERLVEFVDTVEPGVPKSDKWVMMVSTQLGCPVGCRMCDAGAMGYGGNLSAAEILGQVRHIIERNPGIDLQRHPKVKIHFARMGEPALNPEVLTALRLLAKDFPYQGILPSISTVAPKRPAIAPFFEELVRVKDEHFPGGRFQLQFSLHSLDEGKRREIVPVRKWSLEEVADYGRRFVRPEDRKITLNFALGPEESLDPERLAAIFSADAFLVKITPVNPTETAASNGAVHLWQKAPTSVGACADRLRSMGFEVILSPSLPEEISAETSCGQLWSQWLKRRAAIMSKNRRRDADSYVTDDDFPARAQEWENAIARCRRRSSALRPDKAALLVVDFQELFLSPESEAYMPSARGIAGNVLRLVEGFRKAGRPVYFSFHAHRDPRADGGLMTYWWRKVCRAGTPEAGIPAFLGPEKGRIFRKTRYSAFSNRRLAAALRRDGVEELALAGVATNLCVESTARAAFDLGFQPFVALDAAAAHTEELHVAALKNLAWGFAYVCRTDDLLGVMVEDCAGTKARHLKVPGATVDTAATVESGGGLAALDNPPG